MYSTTKLPPAQAIAEAKASAQAIIDRAQADDRPLTDPEADQVDRFIETAQKAKTQMDREAKSARNVAALGTMPADWIPDPDPSARPTGRAKTASPFVKAALAEIEPFRDPHTKALSVSGGVTLPSTVLGGEVVATPARRSFLANLMGPIEQVVGSEYSYLRQTARTNNAAPVAIGDLKPTSAYGLERVTDPVVTIAHLSEPVPRQFVEDDQKIAQFLQAELLNGLMHAVDAQILAGNGVAPNLTGLQAATGVQTAAFDTSVIVTARKALTKLQLADQVAEDDDSALAWAMSPADWEAVELSTTSGSGEFVTDGPVDTTERKLWGVPVTVTNSVPVGEAILGNWSDAELVMRGGINLAWTEAASDDFERNLIRWRCEGRFGLGIFRPASFVRVALTAA